MAKSILTFNDGTNNYILKFGTSTTSTKTGTGKLPDCSYSSSQIGTGDYYLHSFTGLPYNYDLTNISNVANAAQFEVKSVYFNDLVGKKNITDYTVLGTNLTINSLPTYASGNTTAGKTNIFIEVEYISGGYKIISGPTV